MHLALMGGTGRTGWLLLNLALQQGHKVRVLARLPERLGMMHDDLSVREGDARDPDAVHALAKGVDAVISAIGPVEDNEDICSRATANVIASAARGTTTRYVLVSGMAQDFPGDRKTLENRMVSWFLQSLGGAAIGDKARERDLLLASRLDYTALRPPMLTNAPATGAVRFNLEICPGRRLSRGDLAASLLACVVSDVYHRQAPFLSE